MGFPVTFSIWTNWVAMAALDDGVKTGRKLIGICSFGLLAYDVAFYYSHVNRVVIPFYLGLCFIYVVRSDWSKICTTFQMFFIYSYWTRVVKPTWSLKPYCSFFVMVVCACVTMLSF